MLVVDLMISSGIKFVSSLSVLLHLLGRHSSRAESRTVGPKGCLIVSVLYLLLMFMILEK